MSGYEKEIAKVTEAFLGYEAHGILTVYLRLDFGGAGQSAGGYSLDEPTGTPGEPRRGTAFGMEFVIRTMRACGVDEWSKVKGRTIYALRRSGSRFGQVVGIAPLPTESGEPFVFDEIREMAAA